MIGERIRELRGQLPPAVKLVAVSKFHPASAIREAYAAGQRVFGENRPQEFARKVAELGDLGIEWHFIGHLQTNKLKLVLPHARLVQSVDGGHLLDAVEAWGRTNGRVVQVLLEMHIGAEASKQGFREEEALELLSRADRFRNVRFCGLMGMATHTDCEADIRADFARIAGFRARLRDLFPGLADFRELSIGMTGDWRLALEYGATMVRIGTAIFGER